MRTKRTHWDSHPAWTKDPDAVLDWRFDWSDWLGDGEEITSRDITVEPGLDLDSESADTQTVTVWLSGGDPGNNYTVACRIQTTAGRTDERSIVIRSRQR